MSLADLSVFLIVICWCLPVMGMLVYIARETHRLYGLTRDRLTKIEKALGIDSSIDKIDKESTDDTAE